MPVSIRNLSVLHYANGFNLWHYKTDCHLAIITAPGFFADARDMLAPGDHVHVSGPTFGALLRVAAVDDGVRVVVMASAVDEGAGA